MGHLKHTANDRHHEAIKVMGLVDGGWAGVLAGRARTAIPALAPLAAAGALGELISVGRADLFALEKLLLSS